jgi:nitrite reductase/ring-hydroxylating ferredoxin subunit
MKKVIVENKEFLITNVEGKYYAIGARCLMLAATFHRAPWRVVL